MPEQPDLPADSRPGGEVRDLPRPTPGERRLLWWLTGFALVVHLVALYLPGSRDGALELPGLIGMDKLIHGLLFAVPVLLLSVLTGRRWLWVGIFAAHAVVSELVQLRFVAYRDGDVFDGMADLVGIFIVVAYLAWRDRSGTA